MPNRCADCGGRQQRAGHKVTRRVVSRTPEGKRPLRYLGPGAEPGTALYLGPGAVVQLRHADVLVTHVDEHVCQRCWDRYDYATYMTPASAGMM